MTIDINDMLHKKIHTVTVIGANGTMGRNIAAIFASFGNAKVYMVSRSIEKSVAAKENAYLSVKADSINAKLIPTDYSHLEKCVIESDLVFEACAEAWNIKVDTHKRIASIIEKTKWSGVICTGTSGLSITKLAELYNYQYRHQFMGMHLFNPPYQMTLCEMIPTKYIENYSELFEFMMEYAEKVLQRTVVKVTDTPAFLGNRIGFQFINEVLILAEKFKYNGGIDYMDAIVGPFTGRTMPPLVTANFVGLDVHEAIIENIYENTIDYAHDTFVLPKFIKKLITEGKTGRKAGIGLYKTVNHDSGVKLYQVYDVIHDLYREKINYTFPFVEEMIQSLQIGDYESAFFTLVENQSLEARLCCELLIKYIVYSLIVTTELNCEISAADDVMAEGFHWCPPLALLEAFSAVTDFEELCMERLDEKITFALKKTNVLRMVTKSKYDYRKFILAKR